MAFLDDLLDGPLPGDGAMGTELWAAGVPRGACLEELCVGAQEKVAAVHERYLAAGARILRTNSFGANAVRLAAHGFERRVGEINWTAAQLARDCARGRGAHVAGSVGPLGSDAMDREKVFTEQIGALLDGGAQLIFLETFRDLDELLVAVNVKHSLHHCPVIASLAWTSNSGALGAAWARLREAGADVVGINCLDPHATLAAFHTTDEPGPVAVFPSAGLPAQPIAPSDFAAVARQLAARGASLIGGCCGAGPEHIAALAEALGAGPS